MVNIYIYSLLAKSWHTFSLDILCKKTTFPVIVQHYMLNVMVRWDGGGAFRAEKQKIQLITKVCYVNNLLLIVLLGSPHIPPCAASQTTSCAPEINGEIRIFRSRQFFTRLSRPQYDRRSQEEQEQIDCIYWMMLPTQNCI